jgi:GT2 family glycosyltransferase
MNQTTNPERSNREPGAPPVSVVVVNYNGQTFLPDLLMALHSQTWRNFEMVFVDNGSHDDSVEIVDEMCRRLNISLTLVLNSENLGFAHGCNQGIERSQGAWIATLNNDTRPEAGWLECLMACATDEADLGMVAAKLLFTAETAQINSAGIAIDWAGIAWDWRGGEFDRPQEREISEIFGPCAGAALYSRRMLEEVGGFDDDFFAYMEDVDLAWRARLAGWRGVFQPQARVYHMHSATLGDPSSLKSFLLGRNKVWLIAKNIPPAWLACWLPLIIAYDILAIGYGLLNTRHWAILRGRIAGLRGLRHCLAKRSAIHRSNQHTHNWVSMMQPLAPPWAVPKRYAHLYRSAI